jgi:hypothetical protein
MRVDLVNELRFFERLPENGQPIFYHRNGDPEYQRGLFDARRNVVYYESDSQARVETPVKVLTGWLPRS